MKFYPYLLKMEKYLSLTIIFIIMESLLLSIENAIKNKNWYSVLLVCLTIPDICSKLENPGLKTGERYIDWFKSYLNDKYNGFLSGDDCYALRCSYIHEGIDVIEHQSAQKIVDKFVFSPEGAHGNAISNCHFGGTVDDGKNILQLSVKQFGFDIVEAARKWVEDVKSNTKIQKRISNLLRIKDNPTIGNGAIRFN